MSKGFKNWPFPPQASRESLGGKPFATRCPYCGHTSENPIDYAYRYCGGCREFYDWAGQELHAERERVPASAEWWSTLGGTPLAMVANRFQQVEALRERASWDTPVGEPTDSPVLVSAGILKRGGRYLIVRRPAGGSLGGCWELPGGQAEPRELPQLCLARELFEECGLRVVVGELFSLSLHRYEHAYIRLMAYWVTSWSGSVALQAHDDAYWVSPDEFDDVPIAPAHVRVFDALRAQLDPPSSGSRGEGSLHRAPDGPDGGLVDDEVNAAPDVAGGSAVADHVEREPLEGQGMGRRKGERFTFAPADLNAAHVRGVEAARFGGPPASDDLTLNPTPLLTVFGLHVKPDWALRAYLGRDGPGADVRVVAIPRTYVVPAAELWVPFAGLVRLGGDEPYVPDPPDEWVEVPPQARHRFMASVEGDGTPYSYLCASLAVRHLLDFAAYGHALYEHDFFEHRIIAEWPSDFPNGQTRGGQALSGPEVIVDGDDITARFHTYRPPTFAVESVWLHEDRYEVGSYDLTLSRTVVALGRPGTMRI